MDFKSTEGVTLHTFRHGAEFVLKLTAPAAEFEGTVLPGASFSLALSVTEAHALKQAITASLSNMKAVALLFIEPVAKPFEKPIGELSDEELGKHIDEVFKEGTV